MRVFSLKSMLKIKLRTFFVGASVRDLSVDSSIFVGILLGAIAMLGCREDNISITVQPHESHTIFNIENINAPKKGVAIFGVVVREAGGMTVWHIGTFDPSIGFDKQGERSIPLSIPQSANLKSFVINQVIFGTVPEGFEQYFPKNHEPPSLREGMRYTIQVLSGTGAGVLEFIEQQRLSKEQ